MLPVPQNVTYNSNTPIVWITRYRNTARTDYGDSSDDENYETVRKRIPLQNITTFARELERDGDIINPDTPRTPREAETRLRRRLTSRRRSELRNVYRVHSRPDLHNWRRLTPYEEQLLPSYENMSNGLPESTWVEPIGVENQAPVIRFERHPNIGEIRQPHIMEGLGLKEDKLNAYCVKCRQMRPMRNPKEGTIASGRRCMTGLCGYCGTKLTKFLSGKAP
jgi:hypothetical protein